MSRYDDKLDGKSRPKKGEDFATHLGLCAERLVAFQRSVTEKVQNSAAADLTSHEQPLINHPSSEQPNDQQLTLTRVTVAELASLALQTSLNESPRKNCLASNIGNSRKASVKSETTDRLGVASVGGDVVPFAPVDSAKHGKNPRLDTVAKADVSPKGKKEQG